MNNKKRNISRNSPKLINISKKTKLLWNSYIDIYNSNNNDDDYFEYY